MLSRVPAGMAFSLFALVPVDSSQLRRFAAILLLNETTLSELFPFTCKPPVRTWSLSVSLLFRQHNLPYLSRLPMINGLPKIRRHYQEKISKKLKVRVPTK